MMATGQAVKRDDLEANPLRALPPTQLLLESVRREGIAVDCTPSVLTTVAQEVLAELREKVKARQLPAERELLVREGLVLFQQQLAKRAIKRLRPVINATGVVLHTNLGRAPLSDTILEQIREASSGYATLEYNLTEGKRGKREDIVRSQLCALTGAQDALVVNNCAAAVLLACTCYGAGGRGFVVSRGELVEIGGGFRVPDVIASCGARLIEVGTTNKTRVADYERAIAQDSQVAAILAVHRSNFAIVGFTESPERAELASLAERAKVLLFEDLGSGALLDLSAFGLPKERTVKEAIADGVDVVMFSGDKLLGGPQAGFLLGKSSVIEKLRAHPLMRALRPGRLVYAAIEAVLRSYSQGTALRDLPALDALSVQKSTLRARAEHLLHLVATSLEHTLDPNGSTVESQDSLTTGTTMKRFKLSMVEVNSSVGGGTLPTAQIPSWAVAVRSEDDSQPSLIALERALRMDLEQPIIGRIEGGALLLDLRTIFEHQLSNAARGLAQALITAQKGSSISTATE